MKDFVVGIASLPFYGLGLLAGALYGIVVGGFLLGVADALEKLNGDDPA